MRSPQPVSFPKPMLVVLGAGALIGGLAGGSDRTPFSIGGAVFGFIAMGIVSYLLGAYLGSRTSPAAAAAERRMREIKEEYRREHGEDLPELTDEVRRVMDRMLASGLPTPARPVGRLQKPSPAPLGANAQLEVIVWKAAHAQAVEERVDNQAAVQRADDAVRLLVVNGHDATRVLAPHERDSDIGRQLHQLSMSARGSPEATYNTAVRRVAGEMGFPLDFLHSLEASDREFLRVFYEYLKAGRETGKSAEMLGSLLWMGHRFLSSDMCVGRQYFEFAARRFRAEAGAAGA
jgi:hypothetical protein